MHNYFQTAEFILAIDVSSISYSFVHILDIYLQIGSSDAVEKSSASTTGKAKGILKLMKSEHVMLYCHFLADIATILSRLSKIFQRRECCAADIYGMVEETNTLIDQYGTK